MVPVPPEHRLFPPELSLTANPQQPAVRPGHVVPELLHPAPMIVVTFLVLRSITRMALLAESATYMTELSSLTAHAEGRLKRATVPTPSFHPIDQPAIVDTMRLVRLIARMR